VAVAIQDFVTEAFDIDASDDFAFRLRIATETGDRLLAFAFEQADPAERARIIAETKRLLASYLFGA